MKRFVTVGALLALGLISTTAHASTIATATFCSPTGTPGVNEHSTCVVGLGASLQLDLVDLTQRTYTMTLTMDTSSALFPAATYQFIQQVQFDITSVKGDSAAPWGDYESVPVLSSSPSDSGWNVFFDNVNNAAGCSANKNNFHGVCAGAASSGNGTATGDVNVWVFDINLDNDVDALTSTPGLNLRALFVDSNGDKVGDILSPDGRTVDTSTPSTAGDVPGGTPTTPGGTPTTPGGTPTTPGGPTVPGTGGDTAVPEPTSLILLGSGLAYAGSRLRRRRSE